MTKDPVCLMDVDEKKALATSTYKGGTYYFCSHMCKDRFDKELDKEGQFLKKWEAATRNSRH
jgi:YHS domain-containing protein